MTVIFVDVAIVVVAAVVVIIVVMCLPTNFLYMWRCDCVDSRSMSLEIKVLFGNLSLVSAPGFSSRTKVLWMTGYSPGYPVNASENGDFKYNPSKIN